MLSLKGTGGGEGGTVARFRTKGGILTIQGMELLGTGLFFQRVKKPGEEKGWGPDSWV